MQYYTNSMYFQVIDFKSRIYTEFPTFFPNNFNTFLEKVCIAALVFFQKSIPPQSSAQ